MTPEFFHRTFLGTTLGEEHKLLYGNYPKYRGFWLNPRSEEQFEAAFVLALSQTIPNKGEPLQKSFFFVPTADPEWQLAQVTRITKAMFSTLKGRGEPKLRKGVVEKLYAALQHMLIGSRMEMTEPPRWACYGFRDTDPIPLWMKKSILSV